MQIDMVQLIHDTALETDDCQKAESVFVELCAARAEKNVSNRSFSLLLQSYLKTHLSTKYTVSQRKETITFLTVRLAKNMMSYLETKQKEKEEEERKRILQELKEKYGGAV